MRPSSANFIVDTYSRLASEYNDEGNLDSCWGRVTEKASTTMTVGLKDSYKVVVDVGCGPGRELLRLASQSDSSVEFIGLEPAANMRAIAVEKLRRYGNARVLDGCFEKTGLATQSIDYLYSILAFHWTTDLDESVNEVSRILKPAGEMDLVFIGRHNGKEFIEATTPIFRKYMRLSSLLESAMMRKQLTRDAAIELFSRRFSKSDLTVEESYETYYDTLEGHWKWWVRIEGHFVKIPPEMKEQCDRDVKEAMSRLKGPQGIPYTVHLLHVKVRRA